MDQTIENYHQLLWNKEAIKTFLEYSQSFWEYIDKKTITIDDNSYNEAFYGVHIKKDQKGCIIDMKVIVPKIIDLKTACVNVHEWKHAHDLYQIIGKPMDKSDEDYEKSAKEMEKKFQKSIFSQK